MNPMPEEQDVLFSRLRNGDELAYEEIYRSYSKLLLQAAYQKTKDKIVAEDLVQNIFISIWEKRESLMVKDARHYLLGCLKYSVINYIRAQVVENKYIAFSQYTHTEEQEVYSKIELNDLSGILEKGISSLPEKTQEIFRLSRFEHQSIKKISVGLKISEKAVEYHITRSLKFIKNYLKNNYLFTLILFFL